MNKRAVFAIALLVIFGGGYLLSGYLNSNSPRNIKPPTAPKFRKDGTLTFSRPNDTTFTKTINIEIADEEWEITQGLMYRPSMGDNEGMVFIFPDMRKRSFWMSNTMISLDIMYIDDRKKIVTIQKHTVPYSEQSVPSYEDAQYVLEVNAGFSDNYGIKEGDFVEW